MLQVLFCCLIAAVLYIPCALTMPIIKHYNPAERTPVRQHFGTAKTGILGHPPVQ